MNLERTLEQLWEWNIPQCMWACARSRGMEKDESSQLYHNFVLTNHQKRNRLGQLVLSDPNRARLWGWFWLRDNGIPSLQYRVKHDPSWQDAGAKTRSGRDLGWRVFTNEVAQPDVA